MKVGADVIPAPHDMEASDISLHSIEDIEEALADDGSTPANVYFFLGIFTRQNLTDSRTKNT